MLPECALFKPALAARGSRRLLFVMLMTAGCVMTSELATPAEACTSLLVSRGATRDGAVMITYTCDGEFLPPLRFYPAADYGPDEWAEIKDWAGKVRGKVKQPAHTFAVVGWMNEHQLALAETTFDGRMELRNPDGMLGYFDLMRMALQRARTAREAIKVIADLAEEYGYRATGESISIADTTEAWLMELIGPGPGGRGIEWVALRVPDGYICMTANKARIGEFPLDDPDRCLYSKNVISFAADHGYYDKNSGQPFRFCDAYCPATPQSQRYSDTRVWSLFRRAAPSLKLSPDYSRATPGAQPYPLWIKPDEKLGVAEVFALMRDHYEGTPFDMTKGVDAGPFGTPLRSRPITWKVDGEEYAWERPISTQQTAFSFVSQSRADLPDAVGGVLWWGMDDTYTTCYFPLYCGIEALPQPLTVGSLGKFSWDSAWWVFNFVANYANLRYVDMVKDIQAVQRELEGQFLALQPAVEQTAVTLAKTDARLAARYLTDYSVMHGEMVVKRWRELGEQLMTKYNDGFVQDQPGRPQEVGYPEAWLREVIKARPKQFELPASQPAR